MSFFNWLRRKPSPRVEVILYTRPQCCLCHDAAAILERELHPRGLTLKTVNIDTDPQLVERYGLSIPVVTMNGKERFRGQVNAVLLRRLLDNLSD